MVELFVYDASDVNREGYTISYKSPILEGLREALQLLIPPIPFLIRGRQGDYKLSKGLVVVENTFWGKHISDVLKDTLHNGTERSKEYKEDNPRFESEKRYIKSPPPGLRPQDVIWAAKNYSIDLARPYRHEDDCGGFTEGKINDFLIILDPSLYLATGGLFFQPDIELRRKALLGIIISDTNPNRPKLPPLRFKLTTRNLEEVVKNLQETGYY